MPLTDDEALALLELCIYSGWENEPIKNKVMHKLADICKQYECEAAMAEIAEHRHADEAHRHNHHSVSKKEALAVQPSHV